jgi:uncharacterized protein (TIGR03083 family)
MGEWDSTTYEGKPTILRVVRGEAERFFELAAQPGAWDRSTACEGWTVADVVGHIVDTTEGYFESFDAARAGGELPSAYGLLGMGHRSNEQATSFRDLTQEEMISRLRADLSKMMGMLEDVGEEDWAGFIVPHFYMGPVPASFYAAGQLMDYAVHSWDIREGTGREHGIDGDAADLLVPYMFVLWMFTIKPDADRTPFEIGIRVSGHNGGDYRVSISEDGMTYGIGDVSDLTVIEFDAASMVLTTYGRANAGTVRGDSALAERFLNLFFRI